MCQAQLGTFTCLTSICFACFAAWGRDHFCCCGGEVLLLLLLMLRLLLVLVGESKQRGSVTTVTFTLSSLCEQFSLTGDSAFPKFVVLTQCTFALCSHWRRGKPDFKLYSRSSILPPWHPAQPE